MISLATITLGLAASAYDALGVTDTERPQDLRPIAWSDLGDGPESPIGGDFVLQVCSDDVYVAEHAIRRVEHALTGRISTVWTLLGSQRYTSRSGRVSRHEGRALIGFVDGVSNLDPRNSTDDATLVFVDPDAVGGYPTTPPTPTSTGYGPQPPNFPPGLHDRPASEPESARNGTYMVVRASAFDAAAWDQIAQADQEQAVGRHKISGASLDLADDEGLIGAPPAFAADQSNETVLVTAHIRKANPSRSPDDDQRRIFRRGYPLIAGGDGAARRGLIFICLARTISTQFEFIFRGWLRNPDFPRPGAGDDLLLFQRLGEQVLAGGYYFVPPIDNEHEPWSWAIPAAPAP